MSEAYASTAEIDAILTAFNSAEIPPEAFDHRRHLTVAADIVHACADFAIALTTIRAGILRYNAARGVATTEAAGYHETVTRFWTRKLVDLLRDGEDRLAYVNRALAELGDGGLVFTHYDRDTLMSPAARAAFVAPDRRPL
jgi:hypothetical protein